MFWENSQNRVHLSQYFHLIVFLYAEHIDYPYLNELSEEKSLIRATNT